jgi:hypothetical protein
VNKLPHDTGRKKEPIDPVVLQMAKVAVLTAQERLVEGEANVDFLMKVRDEAIRRAKSLGLSLRDIAPLTGRSMQRIAQIEANNLRDEDEQQSPDEDEALALASGSSV